MGRSDNSSNTHDGVYWSGPHALTSQRARNPGIPECPKVFTNIVIPILSGSASFSSSVSVLVSQTKLRIRSALGVAAFTPYWLRSPE